jgi:hypothetical protein
MQAFVQEQASLYYDFKATLWHLEEISEWLHSLGFKEFDRVRVYARNIEQMIALSSREDSAAAMEGISEEKGREILWSYLDADEFVRAVVPLRQSMSDKELLPVVERALLGPADLSRETPGNSAGRNFAYQLVVAGRLAEAGFTPEFTDATDVRFKYDGLDVAVECKRPWAFARLEKNIKAALRQLTKRKADLRIAAVSLSRLFNSGDPRAIPPVEQRADADVLLERLIHASAEATQGCWYGNHDGIGVWFYAFIPILCQESPRYLMTRYDAICPSTKNDENWKRMKGLHQAFQRDQ